MPEQEIADKHRAFQVNTGSLITVGTQAARTGINA